MKQQLNVRLGQQLTMTPAMQQAIKLLQLSAIELEQEINQQLESNMMLERQEDSDWVDTEAPATEDKALDETLTNLPEELPVDFDWDNIYDDPIAHSAPSSASSAPTSELNADERINETHTPTLTDHLEQQLQHLQLSGNDALIASVILDAIQPNGRLLLNLAALTESVHLQPQQQQATEQVTTEEIHSVLTLIQHLDPIGVAATSLAESLTIQAKKTQTSPAILNAACMIIEQHMPELAKGDVTSIRRQLKMTHEIIVDAMQLIRGLSPNPGSEWQTNQTRYVTPEVIVKHHSGGWKVSLNRSVAPRIRINKHYAELSKTQPDADKPLLRTHLQDARWFLRSLSSRHETLLSVAGTIVKEQQAFFNHGAEALKPLVLKDIADQIGLHESTISRVTSSKFMDTPYGVLPFKYFFSSHVATTTGGEASATAIQAIIRKLIQAEPPQKPISDGKLATELERQGIKIARRTVAKYREALSIPPSHARKRLT